MKIKTSTIVWLIMGFVWSIFMGVTATAIGLGALFPPINLVAKPFVCPNGQMNYEQDVSNPLPGTTYTQTYWSCVDEASGAKTELGIFPMSLYSGAFYGLLIFMVVLIIWYFYSRWNPSAAPAGDGSALEPAVQYYDSASEPDRGRVQRARGVEDSLARMKELNKLRDANMISSDEYEHKRAEILKEV
jgi:hypothetical protein